MPGRGGRPRRRRRTGASRFPLVHELMAKRPLSSKPSRRAAPCGSSTSAGVPARLDASCRLARREPRLARPGRRGARDVGTFGQRRRRRDRRHGIDWTHPDFLGEDGTSRILYILDLMLPAVYPDPHPEVDHGIYRIYGKSEIDDALDHLRRGEDPPVPVESTDLVGHGLMWLPSPRARPGRPLRRDGPGRLDRRRQGHPREGTRFEDVDVVLAADFIFSVCDLRGAPCVVNLSLGGQMGGHDGGSFVEQALAGRLWEKPQGRAVVAAAGNHGGAPFTPGWTFGAAIRKTVTLRVPDNAPPGDGGVSRIVLDGWIRGGESAVSLTLPRAPGSAPRRASSSRTSSTGAGSASRTPRRDRTPSTGTGRSSSRSRAASMPAARSAPAPTRSRSRGGSRRHLARPGGPRDGPLRHGLSRRGKRRERGTVDIPATGRESSPRAR